MTYDDHKVKNYFTHWAENLRRRPGRTIPSVIEATGEINRHVGPRMDRVSVALTLEPKDEFEVVDEVPSNEELRNLGYPDYFIYGLLDILMTAESTPITKVKIVLKKANYDWIDSSASAFLEAGRDAGQKVRILVSSAK